MRVGILRRALGASISMDVYADGIPIAIASIST